MKNFWGQTNFDNNETKEKYLLVILKVLSHFYQLTSLIRVQMFGTLVKKLEPLHGQIVFYGGVNILNKQPIEVIGN